MTQQVLVRFWPRMACAIAVGVVAAFGLAPFGYWWATLIALAGMPYLLASVQTRTRAFGLGWALGVGYFAHSLMWIVEPFMVDPERHAWMAPFALLLLAAGLALFWGAGVALFHAQGRGPIARVILLTCGLSLAEYARAYVLTGFPWAALAQVWLDAPASLLLAWVGPHGLAILTLVTSFGLGTLLLSPGASRILALLPGSFFAAATWAAQSSAPNVEPSGHVIRLIQPNAPQHQKWDPAHVPTFFERQLEFTAALPNVGQPDPDLIVWPETAVPVWLENAQPALSRISREARGVPLALGIRRSEGARIYNSMVYLDGQGQIAGIYDKHHLVPFGEYVPFGNLMSRFGIHGFAANSGQGFSAGPGPETVLMGQLGRALPLICYEAVFPQDIYGVAERPEFLLQVTNDAWFGAHSGPYQHLAQARMRAIEQGLPMVRSANTGISAMIDPLGVVTDSLPLGQAGYLDAPLASALKPTAYSRFGDAPPLLLLIAIVLGVVVFTRRDASHI